jgi:hypothetical protein
MAGSSNKPTSSTKSDSEQAAIIVIFSELPQLSPQLSDIDEEQEPRHWNTKKKVCNFLLCPAGGFRWVSLLNASSPNHIF